jgi:DNA mismatch repair protein MutS
MLMGGVRCIGAVLAVIMSSVPMIICQDKQELAPLSKKLEEHCLASVPWHDEQWPNESFYNYLQRCMRYQCNPHEHKKLRAAFKVVQAVGTQAVKQQRTVLSDPTTWTDLCLFKGQHDAARSLLALIGRTSTAVGKATLAMLIAEPTADMAELMRRQMLVKELVDNPVLLKELEQLLAEFARVESSLMSFWSQDQFRQAAKRHYFDFPRLESINAWLNKSTIALDIKTVLENLKRNVTCLSVVAAALVLPLYGASRLLGTAGTVSCPACNEVRPVGQLMGLADQLRGTGGPLLGFLTWLSPHTLIQGIAPIIAGTYCGLSVKDDYEWARDNIILDTCLQRKLIDVAQALRVLQGMASCIHKKANVQQGLKFCAVFDAFSGEQCRQNSDLKELCELLQTSTFQGTSSALSRMGRVLKAYELMHEVKQEWVASIAALGEVDAYVSVAKLYKEFQRKKQPFCFAQFKKAHKPSIELYDFWNPFIDADKVVPNTIKMGESASKNIIVTGPNAGGKSTVLRGIAISLILAQSIGIAPAHTVVITPFTTIATYLNITDDIASGKSLFKSEVMRAEFIINKVKELSADTFSFIIVDEMFSGTSPREGQAAAYSVAKHLGGYNNTLCIVATHYDLLKKLEKEAGFANYKVSVSIAPNGVITYPFKLERGFSDQHIALDILRSEGFAGTILNEARDIVQATH